MGKYIVRKSGISIYHFVLQTGNGETILVGESYSSRKACLDGIEKVRANSFYESLYDKKVSPNRQPYFHLKAWNGQVIGRSEMYESAICRDIGIKAVMSNGPVSLVIED